MGMSLTARTLIKAQLDLHRYSSWNNAVRYSVPVPRDFK